MREVSIGEKSIADLRNRGCKGFNSKWISAGDEGGKEDEGGYSNYVACGNNVGGNTESNLNSFGGIWTPNGEN